MLITDRIHTFHIPIGPGQSVERFVNIFPIFGEGRAALELCRRVVEQIGLPPFAANPLTARTLLAHLAIREVPVDDLTISQCSSILALRY